MHVILARLALFAACRGWRLTAARLYLAAARAAPTDEFGDGW